MTPTIALVALLIILVMRTFFELPEAAARTRALVRGGYKASASKSCLYVLLLPVTLGLWWYYALATDQILLGVIPTAGAAVGIVVLAVDNLATREAR